VSDGTTQNALKSADKVNSTSFHIPPIGDNEKMSLSGMLGISTDFWFMLATRCPKDIVASKVCFQDDIGYDKEDLCWRCDFAEYNVHYIMLQPVGILGKRRFLSMMLKNEILKTKVFLIKKN